MDKHYKYNHSKNGKERKKKYEQSKKGKAKKKEYNDRYRAKHKYILNEEQKERYYITQYIKKIILKELTDIIKSEIKCQKCKIDGPPIIYDFHHIGNKEIGISRLVQNGNINKYLIEIQKCIILCSNCHRIIHLGRAYG